MRPGTFPGLFSIGVQVHMGIATIGIRNRIDRRPDLSSQLCKWFFGVLEICIVKQV